jgi:hypothetical protein
MLRSILDFGHRAQAAIQANIPLEQITVLPVVAEIARMKELPADEAEKTIKALMDRIRFSFAEYGVN